MEKRWSIYAEDVDRAVSSHIRRFSRKLNLEEYAASSEIAVALFRTFVRGVTKELWVSA